MFDDNTESHYDCSINKCYSNIELRWQHLTSGILEYVNVNARNGKFVGNVMTLKINKVLIQCVNIGFEMLWI